MILSNPFDHADAVRARESQVDPLVQYIVVRRERVSSLPHLMVAAAQATVAAARVFGSEAAHADHYRAWRAGSFRKVTLRANERDWPKLLAAEACVALPAADPVVAVLPPRPRSAVSKLITKLQAYAVDPADLPFVALSRPARPAMLIAINPELRMSAGKLLSQVAHAALMDADAAQQMGAGADWAAAVGAWEANGMPIDIGWPAPTGWARALSGEGIDAVVVTDSGLTELDPGSRTVLATRPGNAAELEAWSELLGG